MVGHVCFFVKSKDCLKCLFCWLIHYQPLLSLMLTFIFKECSANSPAAHTHNSKSDQNGIYNACRPYLNSTLALLFSIYISSVHFPTISSAAHRHRHVDTGVCYLHPFLASVSFELAQDYIERLLGLIAMALVENVT